MFIRGKLTTRLGNDTLATFASNEDAASAFDWLKQFKLYMYVDGQAQNQMLWAERYSSDYDKMHELPLRVGEHCLRAAEPKSEYEFSFYQRYQVRHRERVIFSKEDGAAEMVVLFYTTTKPPACLIFQSEKMEKGCYGALGI